MFEVVVFSDALSRIRDVLEAGEPVLLTVDGRLDGEDMRLTAQDIEPLEAAVANAATGLRLFVAEPSPLERLKSLLERESKGRGRVALVLDLADGQEVELELPGGYRLSPPVRQALKSLPGVEVQDL
jgi:DNA polymerase-3 subunit alpha